MFVQTNIRAHFDLLHSMSGNGPEHRLAAARLPNQEIIHLRMWPQRECARQPVRLHGRWQCGQRERVPAAQIKQQFAGGAFDS